MHNKDKTKLITLTAQNSENYNCLKVDSKLKFLFFTQSLCLLIFRKSVQWRQITFTRNTVSSLTQKKITQLISEQ